MLKILEAFKSKEAIEFKRAVNDFIAIVKRRHNPKSGDADRLWEVLKLLGLSETDFEEECICMGEAEALPSVKARPGMEPAKAIAAAAEQAAEDLVRAEKARAAAQPKIEKMFREAEAFRDSLNQAIRTAELRVDAVQREDDSFDRIRMNSRMFGDEWPEPKPKKSEEDALTDRLISRGHGGILARSTAQNSLRRTDGGIPDRAQTIGLSKLNEAGEPIEMATPEESADGGPGQQLPGRSE